MGLYVERASFPRLERANWLWGFTGPQLIWAGSGIGALMLTILATQSLAEAARVLVAVTIPAVAFGLTSIRRRALVSIAAEQGVWMLRKMLGQNRWRVRPEAPIDAHDMPVPGAAGARMKVLSSAFGGGAVLWDARTRWATAVVRCTSTSFAMASDDAWASRSAGFADLLAQLVTHDGVVRVATHARTVPAAAAAAADYYARTSMERGAGPAASPWADHAYTQVLAEASSAGQAQMVSRDVLVTITLDTSVLRDGSRRPEADTEGSRSSWPGRSPHSAGFWSRRAQRARHGWTPTRSTKSCASPTTPRRSTCSPNVAPLGCARCQPGRQAPCAWSSTPTTS